MPDITVADLAARVGGGSVARYFDDDGDNVADPAVAAAIIGEAYARAESVALTAWTGAQVDLLKADTRYRAAVCDIALGLAGERRPEWAHPNTGEFPYAARMKRGIGDVKEIALAHQRLRAEETAGRNKTVLGGSTAGALPAVHVFAPSQGYPSGRGGF